MEISKSKLRFDNKYLNKIKKKDVFYNLKFKKNMFRFPYCICYLKNLSLNTSIFYNLILNKILPNINIKYKNYFYFKAYSAILKNNIKESHHYYENFYFKNKFSKLIKHIDLYFKKKIDYSIIIVPQYFDLKLSKSRNKYIKFYRELKESKRY